MVKVANNFIYKFRNGKIFRVKKERFTEKVIQQNKCLTRFKDLSDEILLMICHYLTPAHVIKAFLHYDNRMSRCLWEYRHTVNLSKCSYTDFQYFLKLLKNKKIKPSKLILSNSKIRTQIQLFFEKMLDFDVRSIYHLSLIKCTEEDFDDIDFFVKQFRSLQSLTIIESSTNDDEYQIESLTIETLRNLIFGKSFNKLTVVQLRTNNGIVLDKTLCIKKCLKRMIISLEKVDDLLVLFDGLTPNLMLLDVTLCNSHTSKRSAIPRDWPRRSMHYLIDFRLKTNDNVEFTFEHLKGIVMPLIKVQKFTLDVKQWNSDNQKFVEGMKINTLIGQYMTELCYFRCFIQSTNDINVQDFGTLNERWPMLCGSQIDNSYKHIYTIPWTFKELHISMLSKDDTISVCPIVQILTIDVPCKNLSYRFPNIHTLIVLSGENLSRKDCAQFRRVEHLIVDNINMVPFPARHIYKLTLLKTTDLLIHSTIHSNIQHLVLDKKEVVSLDIVKTLVQNFPNLHSLDIELNSNEEYYDSLDILLDKEYLPYLSLLRTNWIDDYTSNIQVWLASNTPLKWKLTSVYGECADDRLTISL